MCNADLLGFKLTSYYYNNFNHISHTLPILCKKDESYYILGIEIGQKATV